MHSRGRGSKAPRARRDFSSQESFFAREFSSPANFLHPLESRLLRGGVRSLFLLRFAMMARALHRLVFSVVEADENGIIVVQLRSRQRQHDEFRDYLEGRLHAA